MGKCLVTKINAVVKDEMIPKVGEVILPLKTARKWLGTIEYATGKEGSLRIIGEGTFASSSDNGSTLIPTQKEFKVLKYGNLKEIEWIANAVPGKTWIAFDNKYDIIRLKGFYCQSISAIKYSKNIQEIENYEVQADISDLPSNLNALSRAVFYNGIKGSILPLCKASNINALQVFGDFDSFDISNLAGLTKLKTLYLTSHNLHGDIGVLANMPELDDLDIYGTVSGDIGKLPPMLPFFECKNFVNSKFTWSTERPSSACILALSRTNLGNYVDAMLINQAKCTYREAPSGKPWYHSISVIGTRTSASDAALQTLQGKGYTVSVAST